MTQRANESKGRDRAKVSILLDTNVFVAAYWARSSASARLLQACIDGRIEAHYSPEVKREVLYVLRTIRARSSYLDYVDCFWAKAREVRGVSAGSVRTSDPDDQKFLEAALGGETDFLVTSDEHLLEVGYIGRTEILTPSSALKSLDNEV